MSARVTRYEIRDACGETIAVHVRRDRDDGSKDLIWERPDGTSGLNGLPTSQLPLYGSEDVRGWDENDSVIIVEGEKARDALTEHGFRALATVTGAAGCPALEPLAVLRGRKAILWPDADPVGVGHMRRLTACLESVAASVQVFEWNAAPEHGDAADYLAGGTEAAERLRIELEAAKSAEEWGGSGSAAGSTGLVAAAFEALPEEPTLHDRVEALRRVASALNGRDSLERAAIRHEVIERLKSSGLAPGEARDLTAAAFRGDRASGLQQRLQGTALELADPEAWPSVVDGPTLADEIAATFTRHIVLPSGAADALALWTLLTHAHSAFQVSPILALISPEKRCGKTNTLLLLNALTLRPMVAANLSSAVLYRSVDRYGPTLLMDEAETYLRDNEELRGILNAGHARAGARVLRCEGDSNEPRVYSAWCPKAVAMIGRLPGTLEDRAVMVTMRRKAPREACVPFRIDRSYELEPARRQAWRWAQDWVDQLRDSDPVVPRELHDRAQDNWRPLLAIADALGGDWPTRARHAALFLAAATPESDSTGETLLADIHGLFDESGVDRLSSEAIVAGLLKLEGRPWPDWKGKGLTKNQLARQLRKFGIDPGTVRFGDQTTAKGYYREPFEDAWARYLQASSKASHRHGPASTRLEPLLESVTEALPVTDGNYTGAAIGAAGDVVTDWGPTRRDPTHHSPSPLQAFMDGLLGGSAT